MMARRDEPVDDRRERQLARAAALLAALSGLLALFIGFLFLLWVVRYANLLRRRRQAGTELEDLWAEPSSLARHQRRNGSPPS